jgi:pimeloyl-ACP methyl ester carboxylesterase
MHCRRVLGLWPLVLLAGCVGGPTNPSFAVSPNQAKRILLEAARHPKPLQRPLVIVGGFMDPGFASSLLGEDFQKYTHDNRIIRIALGDCTSFEQCRRRIIKAVDRSFPTTDPSATREVDVIGYSMGGLAARYAAEEAHTGRRLRIARLFTISSPLRGAILAAELPLLHPLQKPMRPGSAFLRALNADPQTLADAYPIYSYVCLNDESVGPANAAALEMTPWWVSASPFFTPHDWALLDPRIRADIARRLRDEPPLAHDPPSPIPAEKEGR